MEKESFEDLEVAKLLNKLYISIKVDREERPDIDNIYMTFCQATTGSGGWPMSVFLTPDKKPFYAGTYFPKHSKYGQPGFMDILNGINKNWQSDKDNLLRSADKVARMLENINKTSQGESIVSTATQDTYTYYRSDFDATYGGFGNAPKFPSPHHLLFLLRYYKTYNNPTALDMVEKTLIQMYKGGIFDHVGYGFSRYSTDKRWLVPHFEKMLYDNALLVIAYTEVYQITKKEIYKEIAEKTLTYISRDMMAEHGGFYSAEDADSEGVEGKFYVWDLKEIVDILGEEDAKLYCRYYDITEKGNFEFKNIPNLIEEDFECLEDHTIHKLSELNSKLFDVRKKRIHPYKDDKILTSWNGLMIVAFATAGRVFNNESYLQYAKESIEFIEKNLIREDGRLLARYRDGDANLFGYLDDYAFMIWAYIEMYEALFNVTYIKKALQLNEEMIRLFGDEENGGFYLYGIDAEQLISRPKEIYDGAIPSGNAVAAYNLLRLSKITGDMALSDQAYKLFECFGSKINQTPYAYTFMVITKMFADSNSKEIVLAGHTDEFVLQEMLTSVNDSYLPYTIVLLNDGDTEIQELNDFIQNQTAIDGKPTAYVCENFRCNKPVQNVDEFRKLIEA